MRAPSGPISLTCVAALQVALRAKHGATAAHSLRVGMYASAWGYAYGLREDHVHLFEMTGLMHEIGKIGIPDRVLQKPDGLNDQERAMMGLQPHVGVEILKAAGATPPLLTAIANLGIDYSALPNPSATDSAAMSSRLIRVIDAYDSMTSRSVYRDPLSKEDAVSELIRNAGTQFDPKLARSFAQLVMKPKKAIEDRVQLHWQQMLPQLTQHLQFQFDIDGASSPNHSSPMMHIMNDTFYRHMLNSIQQGVIFVDSDFRVLQWNKAASMMTGQPIDVVLHQFWKPSLVGFCDRYGYPLPDHQCPFLAMLTTGEKSQQKMMIKRDDGTILDVQIEVVPVTNERGKMTGGAIILNDVSEQQALEQTIIHLNERATQDQLTKVANRGELIRQLPAFIKNHVSGDPPGAIIICDIDFFKRVNDHFSHQAGDEALKLFATLLRDSCRSTDLVARYGGEEFVILCSQCDLAEAKGLAESIRNKLQRTPIPALRGACITASFGVTEVLPGDDEEIALGRADRGLLMAKENGRDQVICIVGDQDGLNNQGSSKPSTWMEWVELASNKTKLDAELVTNVPKTLAYDKLRGFANEFLAVITSVQNDFAIFEIDCKNTPMPRQPNERLGKHRIHVGLREIEMRAGAEKNIVRQATLIRVIITPLHTRDRREDANLTQCARLMQALQCYLLAEPFDASMKADLIRVIKPENDSRYR
ncbi:MAG: diguanylate cyclase [Pirellula sp.]|nr:diguanylate cyclase [Pirellula sp.]